MLQKHVDDNGTEFLSSADKLFVVHVKQGKDPKEKAWSAGGPLLPSLSMALARYPHTIIELEVLPQQAGCVQLLNCLKLFI